MIKDKLEYSETYYKISDNIKIGFEWLKSQDTDNLEDGRYQIVGDKVYANVQTYETKDNADYEAHKKYIDIQYVVKGNELIGVCDVNDCVTCKEYDEEKDIEFLKCKKDDKYQHLEEGEFLVLFPTDAHKPSISPKNKTEVKKIVVKAAIG